jgi:hypothetical protein
MAANITTANMNLDLNLVILNGRENYRSCAKSQCDLLLRPLDREALDEDYEIFGECRNGA